VLPMLSIAQQLSDNGERVVFLSNGYFKHLFESIDIEFIQLSSSQEYEHLISTVNVNSTYDLTVALVKHLLLEPIDSVLTCLENISREGNIILIANGTNLGARLYHDKTGCDFVSAYFAPCVLPSGQFFPRLFRWHYVNLLPFSLRKVGLKLIKFFINFLLLNRVNRLRFVSGLPRSRNVLDLFHSPQSIIGLYPQKFLGITPEDWPTQFQTVAFPIFQDNLDISESLEKFLSMGTEPILVCRGTPNTRVENFMEKASRAILNLNERAILVSGHFQKKSDSYNGDVFYANFLPYSRVIPRCKAVIHHGGIGTSAQCLKSGVPQLIAPWGVDQWDNSMRLKDLGVALELDDQEGSSVKIESKLRQLLKNSQIKLRSKQMAEFKDDYLGAEVAAQYLLEFRELNESS